MEYAFKWHRFSEELPPAAPTDRRYLTYSRGIFGPFIEILYYDRRRNVFYRSDGEWGIVYIDNVKAWAELPPAPEEKEQSK